MRRSVSFQLGNRKHLGEAASCLSSGDQMDNGEGSGRESWELPASSALRLQPAWEAQ